jgi:hypothetical protein
MTSIEHDKKWALMIDLRKEMVEAQKIRAQMIGFKITFISTATGLVIADIQKIPHTIWSVLALASIFFDLLINNYSFGIDRIAFYCRHYLEPAIKTSYQELTMIPLWEEFVATTQYKQKLSFIGNLGITCLMVLVAIIGLFTPFNWIISIPLLILILLLFVHDFNAFMRPKNLDKTIGKPDIYK